MPARSPKGSFPTLGVQGLAPHTAQGPSHNTADGEAKNLASQLAGSLIMF